jgi:dolichyl-phosphate beta-glucosyltransferase
LGPVYLSVVIPVYNEQDRVLPALEKIIPYLSGRGKAWEVIVVDDGSADSTAGLVREFASRFSGVRLISYKPNRGKGYAVRTGVMDSRGDNVLFTDVDLSAPIEESAKLLACLDSGCDVAVGSRNLSDSNTRTSPLRKFVGLVFNFIVRSALLPGISDTQCGFKCFRAAAAKKIFGELENEGFTFDVEALYLAKLNGFRMKEVPITWSQSDSSRVNVFRDSIKMFSDILEIRKRLKNRRDK